MTCTEKKYRFAYSKRAVSGIVLCVAAVCVLALATSTRPAEYQAMSGFMMREEAMTASKALLPYTSAAKFSISAKGKRLISLGAGNETDSAAAGASDAPMTADQIEDKAQEWVAQNPHEARKVMFAIYLGLILLFVGLFSLIYSEISTVFVVQELDVNLESGLPMYEELEERAARWARGMRSTHRPWFSLGGVGFMLAGTLIAQLPLCSVMADWGLPEAASTPGDCYTVVVLDAALQVVLVASLAASVAWSCIRPYASLLLASIALGAFCAQVIADPIFTLIWALLSGGLAVFYLSAVPEAQEGYMGEKKPLKTPSMHGNMV